MNANQLPKPILLGFMPALGLPDPGPFVLKTILFMRMHNIEFDLVPGDLRKTPQNKIPVLKHDGKTISDSEFILDYLSETYSLLADDLTPEQHAQGHMICRALEERTYWLMVMWRWTEEPNASTIRDIFFKTIPSILRKPIFKMVQKSVKRDLYGQGSSRHPAENAKQLARRDLEALSTLLGEKPYLFGDKPTRYDCTLGGLLGQFLQKHVETPLTEITGQYPNLVAYWHRMEKKL